MYILKENIEDKENIVKKSKFITYIYNVNNINEINNYLKEIKQKYNDATHICYAYILQNIEKYDDDKEPSGTAGYPILNLLKKKNITNTLAIVIRYYGGIKLGTGGLTRAYSNSVKDLITNKNIISFIEKEIITLITDYDNLKILNSITKDFNILNKSFEDKIIYIIEIEKNKLIDLNNKIKKFNIILK